MNAILRFGLLVLFLTISVAARAETCPDTYYINDLPEGTVADIIHPLPATPGAFGGEVACAIAQTSQGVEQYMVEFLPRQETNSIVVSYKQDLIRMRYTYLPENRGVNLVECTKKTAEQGSCVVDLSGGEGLYLIRSFTPDGAINQIRIVARPNMGLINQTALPFFLDATPEQRQVTLEVVEAGHKFTMVPQGDQGLYAIAPQDIQKLGNLLFNEPYSLKFAYAFQREVGGQSQDIASDWTISKGTIDFVMTQLFRMEALMIKGVAGTVDFRF